MQNVSIWITVASAASGAVAVVTVFLFIIRNQNTKIAFKQEIAMCAAHHKRIDEDLARGESKFADLMGRHERAIAEMASVNTQLSLITQRLDIYAPFIKSAADLVTKAESNK